MKKITPFLWFNNQAEEAADFYTSIFPNSRINAVTRYDEAGAKASGQLSGSVMIVAFELNGQEFTALNGGPAFSFSQAISFLVNCESQEEVDTFWDKLSAGGEKQECGWLKDKYGVSWQIVPSALGELMSSSNPEVAKRVMAAMLQMDKIDINKLEKAAKS
jgi:predicted 3-demethylubiquinone-9 3-methyltransferase (glyoxalase superfamily)